MNKILFKNQFMKYKCVLIIAVVFLITAEFSSAFSQQNDDNLKFTVIYDNYDFKEGLKSDWGFSCLIEFNENTILFDTGTRPSIFKQNFEALNITAETIDYVIISHDHGDHTGGLTTFLEYKNNVDVFLLESFSNSTKNIVLEKGSNIRYEPKIKEIAKNVFLSGQLGNQIEEQALAFKTSKGLVIITGCSHPGINNIINHFKLNLDEDIYMVLGGFHLMRKNTEEMNNIITEMKTLGVKKCGASHCTGDKQIEMFKDAFGKNYIELGVGREIELK